ncbi:hypothetical protein GCM10009830_01050 [Glycomyces endophyticus]|uniref:Uncharacterized protein n=1 Tax=Glycomyces endophyticus TaxID=480996 RepID=A0ABP4RQN6_9ACTN
MLQFYAAGGAAERPRGARPFSFETGRIVAAGIDMPPLEPVAEAAGRRAEGAGLRSPTPSVSLPL